MLTPRTVLFLVLIACHHALAQSAPLQFEVASIRRNPNSLARPFNLPLPGGGINYTGDSLKDLISAGWEIDPDRIIGGPSWVDFTRYDIRAKAAAGAMAGLTEAQTLQNISVMVRALVWERFHLAVHREARDMNVLALGLTRKDGRLGPAIREPDGSSCQPLDLSAAPTALSAGKLPPLTCGMGFLLSGGRLLGSGVDFGQLAAFLNRFAGQTVVDKTGVSRKFDIDMEWPASLFRRPSSTQDSDEPTLFSVLEEQAGLKLQAQKSPVEIVVIDHAEEPSGD